MLLYPISVILARIGAVMSHSLFANLPVSKKTLTLSYKVIVMLSVISIFYFLYQMIASGVFGATPGSGSLVTMNHVSASYALGWATLLHIVIIKLGVRMKGGSTHDTTFYVHLVFAILYTLLVALFFFVYSMMIPYQALLTVLTALSFAVVTAIGIPMLLKRF